MAKKKPRRKSASHRKKTHKKILAGIIIGVICLSFVAGILIASANSQALSFEIIHSPKMNVFHGNTATTFLPTSSVKVPILVYHYIEYVRDPKDTVRKSLDILPPTFEEQIKTLKNAQYNFITAAELGQYLDGKRSLPTKPVMLTFDDGYGDFYTDVFPILKKYNVVATEYIISGGIDKLNYMTTEQVREIAGSGLVEIGAHTVHHHNLKSLPLEDAKKEIDLSKSDLEREFGINVVSFAYPYGSYNENIADLVKKAGFTNAVGTKGGYIVNQEDRYTLFRIHPGAAIGEGLLKAL